MRKTWFLIVSMASAMLVAFLAASLAALPVAGQAETAILVGAGDIAKCSSSGDEATARLLDGIPGTVFTLGDNMQGKGTSSEFNNCYDSSWGKHKERTMPAPGNHEYLTPGATGYFGYFGAAAGNPSKGYYSYDRGSWHIVVLNSNCDEVGGCAAGSPQERWLENDLAANATKCTLAYWHHPRFSSGRNNPNVTPFWRDLYEAGAEVVLNGHTHTYERFALQRPNGTRDGKRGIREFIVGTGGGDHDAFRAIKANSQVRNASTYGVLKLTLKPDSYAWKFVPVAGKTFTDSGSTSCH